MAGALVLSGMTKGVYVTTSKYTSGAIETAKEFRERGVKIALWNADTFYDKLKMTQRAIYTRADDETAPYFKFWKDEKRIPVVFSNSW